MRSYGAGAVLKCVGAVLREGAVLKTGAVVVRVRVRFTGAVWVRAFFFRTSGSG